MTQSGEVAVVGAGVSGLTAAFLLARAGLRVVVFEAAHQLGGRMRTVSRSGFRWDVGGHALWTSYTTAVSLARSPEVGVALRRIRPSVATVTPGYVLHHMSGRSPVGLLTNPALSARTKLRLAKTVAGQLPRRRMFDLHHPQRAAALDDGASLRSWGDATLGADAVDHLLAPLTSAPMLWSPEQTPWWAALRMLLQMGDVLLPRDGLGAFLGPLSRRATVVTQASVVGVSPAVRGRVRLRLDGPAPRRDSHVVDRVVLATPAPVTREIVGDPVRVFGVERGRYVESAEYVPGAQAVLGYDLVPERRAMAVAVPEPFQRAASSVVWEQLATPPAAPAGCALASVYPAPRYAAASQHADDQELLADLAASVEDLYPRAAGHVVLRELTRWRHAMPTVPPGRIGLLVRALREQPEAGAAVFACGDYWEGPSVEMSMISGVRAAGELLAGSRRRAGPTVPAIIAAGAS